VNKVPLRQRSALVYVLIALIPYSKPNILLAFKPGLFFLELEKISKYKKKVLQNAYYRGVKDGLIDTAPKNPRLSALGERRVAPFVATRLGPDARLMVIFDVPEEDRGKRQSLRNLLKLWGFNQVQKSVWTTNYDFRVYLTEFVDELGLDGCVEIYESLRHYPKLK